MSARDDAQALVDRLESLHNGLFKAWLRASNSGDFSRAKELKVQTDRAGDRLIDAREHLLEAIDSGNDITDLLARMTELMVRVRAEQKKVKDGTAAATEISGVLDTFGQVITLAETLTTAKPDKGAS